MRLRRGTGARTGKAGKMGTTISSDGLDPRRKRVLFRAWHRGTREMDLLLGQFADHAIAGMSEVELDAFEALMEVPDRDLFSWIAGREAVPGNYDTGVLRRVVAFHDSSAPSSRTSDA